MGSVPLLVSAGVRLLWGHNTSRDCGHSPPPCRRRARGWLCILLWVFRSNVRVFLFRAAAGIFPVSPLRQSILSAESASIGITVSATVREVRAEALRKALTIGSSDRGLTSSVRQGGSR